MVKLVSLDKFFESVGRAMRPRMNMSIYNGTFDCACGSPHTYGEHIELLCEGSMRVVMVCPNDSTYLTNVAIRTFMIVKFKGFESLAGTKIETNGDQVAVMAMQRMLQ